MPCSRASAVAAEAGEDELLGSGVPVEVDGEAGPGAEPLPDGDVGGARYERPEGPVARRTKERLVHGMRSGTSSLREMKPGES